MTTAYKFLAAGAVGPLSRVPWPAIGSWLVVDEPIAIGKRGAHVCRADDLSHWLHDELWRVEVAGDRVDGPDCVVVSRARLVDRVAGWNRDGITRFARACLAHARELVGPRDILDDGDEVLRHGYAAIAAYNAAVAVAAGDEAAYAVERAWQSAWIVRELIESDRA